MIYVVNVFSWLVNSLLVQKFLHLYQLKDYSFSRYNSAIIKRNYVYILINILLFCLLFINNLILTLTLSVGAIMINPIFNLNLVRSKKTPLVFTAKIKRLYVISVIILAIPIPFKFGAILINILCCFVPVISNLINVYDKLRNKKFINQAREKLKLSKTKVIAITGSNGKTSVKSILFEMLKNTHTVIASPKSYNTPLGTAKFINESLTAMHEFVILEYGARKRGDIKKLCKLFGADFGIVTCVAPQHLQTFHSIENVYKTKKELPDFLGSNLTIFNLDNDQTKRMFQHKIGNKLGVSIERNADVFASNIEIKDFRTQFVLHLNGNIYQLSTRLLGRHNITNIILATALAFKLGVPVQNIIKAVENLNYVPHRLELIRGKMNILDDSYNCSLASATEAVWVLNQIKQDTNCHTMIVTPGIIEGGKFEQEINFKLGELCSSADFVVIVGEQNKKALSEGLQLKNHQNTIFAHTLDDAKKEFVHLKANDTLLLLNDLPDDYK